MTKDLLQHPFFKRLWSILGAVSIRTKVLGIVVGTVLLLGTFVTGVASLVRLSPREASFWG